MKQKILRIICIALGIVYLYAGLNKILDTASVGNLIVQYGFGIFQVLAPFIVLVQIALGLCLVLGVKLKLMSLVSFAMLVVFTLAFTYAHLQHGVTDCGCFGASEKEENNVLLFYLRNAGLMALSLFVFFCYSANNEETSDRKNLINMLLSLIFSEEKISDNKKMILLGVMLPMIFVAGLTYRMPHFHQQAEEHILLNQHIRDTPLYQHIQTDSDNSYLLFFFSYTCPHCWNSIANFKHFGQSMTVDSIVSFAFVDADMPEEFYQFRDEFIDFFGDIRTRELVNDSIMLELVPFVPTSFYIRNDTIKAVIEGALPSPFTFRKFHR